MTPRRVLVVEDQYLVALLIEDMLAELGHEPVGPAQRLDAALALAHTERIDLGLLDLTVAGAKTYAVADVLAGRGIPFAFVTGGDKGDIAPAYEAAPVLLKPFRAGDLQAMIDRLLPQRP